MPSDDRRAAESLVEALPLALAAQAAADARGFVPAAEFVAELGRAEVRALVGAAGHLGHHGAPARSSTR